MTLNRRQFLSALTGATAAAAVPWSATGGVAFAADADIRAAARLTTLAQTLRAGAPNDKGYRRIVTAGGEAHVVRDELAKPATGRARRRRSLLSFVHLTDQHIIDVQSPSRVEFLDRYSDDQCGSSVPFSSAHRPQEAACARISDAMLQRLRRIRISPVTGAPIAAAICTGDNTDNQQINELEWFMALMNGGRLNPNSGDPQVYEGVQKSGDEHYWHPDPAVQDNYKTNFGFPSREGWLEDALSSFRAVGVGLPWYTCYGNHDGLAQGNAPANGGFEQAGTGRVKVTGLAGGANPCDGFANLGLPGNPPFVLVTADDQRAYISRRDWIARHLETTGKPTGHGFTSDNVQRNTAYYAADVGPLRFITLDTVNPGGLDSGSIGEVQFGWLEAELKRAEKQRRLVLLFSHHGLRSLDNPNEAPSPNGEDNDLPRLQGDAVEALVAKFSCVIAWVNGHSHQNVIVPRKTYWDVGTAAHIDWPAQARIIDVVDNRDGTLSIFTTLFDHEDDPIVSFARELSGNDPQAGFASGTGKREDRNTELVLLHPFARAGDGGDNDSGVGNAGDGRDLDGGSGAPLLPATGGGSAVTVGGALVVAAGAGLMRLRERSRD